MSEIVNFRSSRKIYFPIYLMIMLLIGIIAYIKINTLPLNPIALTGAAGFILLSIGVTEVHRLKNSYQITSHYLAHTSGIIAKSTTKILIDSIIDIDSKQKVWQRLLGFGNIDVHSTSGANIIKIQNINNPTRFIELLEQHMPQKRQ